MPEETIAVETPTGLVLYVSDAQNGVLIFEVPESSIKANSDIEIVALDDEMTPLAAVHVPVLSDNEIAILGGKKSLDGWVIAVLIALNLLVLAAAVILILWRSKQKQKD